jgi:murein L,D-transpeptidase YafK
MLLNPDRATTAHTEKAPFLKKIFAEKGIIWSNFELFFRVLKLEQILEVWIKNKDFQAFQHFQTYSFCVNSGTLGPKRSEGDRQIPEGIYHLNRFNPQSKFYLSLGLNYPNPSDTLLREGEQAGGDIFIHGGCKSTGCVAVTDDKIKEIYTLAAEAKRLGQTHIRADFFPMHLRQNALDDYLVKHPEMERHRLFWQDLERIYQDFEQTKKLKTVNIDANGRYFL